MDAAELIRRADSHASDTRSIQDVLFKLWKYTDPSDTEGISDRTLTEGLAVQNPLVFGRRLGPPAIMQHFRFYHHIALHPTYHSH